MSSPITQIRHSLPDMNNTKDVYFQLRKWLYDIFPSYYSRKSLWALTNNSSPKKKSIKTIQSPGIWLRVIRISQQTARAKHTQHAAGGRFLVLSSQHLPLQVSSSPCPSWERTSRQCPPQCSVCQRKSWFSHPSHYLDTKGKEMLFPSWEK